MPYRYAHYFVGSMFLVVLVGFWSSYWAPIGTVPTAFHTHALTAMAWLALLMVQTISIQRRHNALHRQMGLASLLLFPLLIGRLALIADLAAQRFAPGVSAGARYNAGSFMIGTFIAMIAYVTLFYLALKHRRNVTLHAGYMLATPVIMFESPFSRVMGEHLPWLNLIGSEGPHGVQDTILTSDVIAAGFALAMYLTHRKHGAPWLLTIAFTLVQGVVMWTAPLIPQLEGPMRAYAQIPLPVTLSAALTAGALAGWLGWRAGARPRGSVVAAAA
jgi:hypothetical protein